MAEVTPHILLPLVGACAVDDGLDNPRPPKQRTTELPEISFFQYVRENGLELHSCGFGVPAASASSASSGFGASELVVGLDSSGPVSISSDEEESLLNEKFYQWPRSQVEDDSAEWLAELISTGGSSSSPSQRDTCTAAAPGVVSATPMLAPVLEPDSMPNSNLDSESKIDSGLDPDAFENMLAPLKNDQSIQMGHLCALGTSLEDAFKRAQRTLGAQKGPKGTIDVPMVAPRAKRPLC